MLELHTHMADNICVVDVVGQKAQGEDGQMWFWILLALLWSASYFVEGVLTFILIAVAMIVVVGAWGWTSVPRNHRW